MGKYSLQYINYLAINKSLKKLLRVVHITINGNNQGLIQNPNI